MRLGFWEIVVVFAVIFLLFGAKRLPVWHALWGAV